MELSKLAKQVKREFKASPARAVVLVVVIAVAIYFWAPLVVKWTGGKKKPKAVEAAIVATSTTPEAVVAAAPSVGDLFQWKRFLEAVRSDESMGSAKMPELAHNPFRSLSEPAAELREEGETAVVAAPIAQWIPFDELGLQLQSTLVSRRGGTAMIDGELVTLMKDDSTPKSFTITRGEREIELMLIEVRDKAVELQYAGETYVLAIEGAPADRSSSVTRH